MLCRNTRRRYALILFLKPNSTSNTTVPRPGGICARITAAASHGRHRLHHWAISEPVSPSLLAYGN